ncbi:MAG: hypothetical protein IPO34_21190 [Dehalococcoidia bacterium]|nr:hypothetical protein [Dehalococcoidia bacterium]
MEYLGERGYNLNISTADAGDEEDIYLKHIRSRRFDGFILVRTHREDNRINLLQKHGVPFVACGRMEHGNDFHLVDDDGRSGVRQIVDHLCPGPHRLACIAEIDRSHQIFSPRPGLYRRAASHGPPPAYTLTSSSNPISASGPAARAPCNYSIDRRRRQRLSPATTSWRWERSARCKSAGWLWGRMSALPVSMTFCWPSTPTHR